jgi:hypothetical protein
MQKTCHVQYTDTKGDALFHFTDRMTQDERLPGREKDAGVWAGYINFNTGFLRRRGIFRWWTHSSNRNFSQDTIKVCALAVIDPTTYRSLIVYSTTTLFMPCNLKLNF